MSTPISRWLITDFLSRCRYSIGSSMVMMCAVRVALISSIIAASVVVLPLPVAPVTRTRPRSSCADLLEHRRQRQLVDRGDVARNDTEHHADGAALLERVAAEAAQAGDAVGEVDLVVLLELVAVADRQHRGRHRDHLLVLEPLVFQGGHEAATHPHHGERADLQVQVRSAAVDGDFEQVVDVHCSGAGPRARHRANWRSPAPAAHRRGRFW